jgi:hypothetical protein
MSAINHPGRWLTLVQHADGVTVPVESPLPTDPPWKIVSAMGTSSGLA